MPYKFRPMSNWPRTPTEDRRNSTFRATYEDTLALLDFELEKVATNGYGILQIAIPEADFRRNGTPRVNAVFLMPGVVLTFDSEFGSLMYACDAFNLWTDNLRAIALTLENLRAVERYGATKHGEQYRGYTAIESKESDGFAYADQAAFFISQHSQSDNGNESLESCTARILHDERTFNLCYRRAAGKLHPDSTQGDHDLFVKLQKAKEMIETHYKGAAK